MKWEKLGLICEPIGEWWSTTHCYTPTPYLIDDRKVRVYYSSWDDYGRGRMGYADFSTDDPTKLLYQTKEPILDIGEPGTFDCDGVCPEYIVDVNGKKYLYYIGFQRTAHNKVDFIFCGLAIGDGYSFKKYSTVPLMDRIEDEQFIRSSVSILKYKTAYLVWYTASRTGWKHYDGAENYHSWNQYPTYDISFFKTFSPLHFNAPPIHCIGLRNEDEIAVGRPWVIYDNNKLKMWYSVKKLDTPYKIAYAESVDGRIWVRPFSDEEIGLQISKIGFDDEMICFPAIIDIKGERYAFYNGNGHGRDGIGLARLVK